MVQEYVSQRTKLHLRLMHKLMWFDNERGWLEIPTTLVRYTEVTRTSEGSAAAHDGGGAVTP